MLIICNLTLLVPRSQYSTRHQNMITSSNGSIFLFIGLLCGEFTVISHGIGFIMQMGPVFSKGKISTTRTISVSRNDRKLVQSNEIGIHKMSEMMLYLHHILKTYLTNPTMQHADIHNAPFCDRNVRTCAHFCDKIVHCGIWDWCIVGFLLIPSCTEAEIFGEWVSAWLNLTAFFVDSGQRGPYSPYKPCNHSPRIGIIILPHIDNTIYRSQLTWRK